MKSKAPLIVSIALNVVLVALLVRPSEKTEHAQTPDTSSPEAPRPASAITSARTEVATAQTNLVVREFNWETVESPDYREYIKNLRSIGVPEETIRDIIIADVNKLYAQKKKLARGEPKKFEFWKSGNPMAGMLGDPETIKAMRELEEEKQGVLRALGIEPDPMDSMMAMAGADGMNTMFDFLPEEKRTVVTKAMTDFSTKMMENAQDGGADPEALLKSQMEMQNAIKAVLTPEEFLDYQLRFSTTALTMRMQLNGFEPNEQEFLDVFKLKAEFDEEYPAFGVLSATAEEAKKRGDAQNQLNEQIKEVLGDERYSDYQRSQDYQYQQLNRIVKSANLDASIADEVYDMKQIAEEQAQKLRTDSNLSKEQRDAALLAIRQETEHSIQQTMGDDGWNRYNRPINIHWLNRIASESTERESNDSSSTVGESNIGTAVIKID